MQLSGTELGILGFLALVLFGGALKLGGKKKSPPPPPKANFQENNTDYTGHT